MSVSTIDGTLESVTVKRRASKIWQLKDMSFRKADGGVEAIAGSVVVTPEIGAALQPGVSGRFYFYKGVDQKGIHAIRPTGGSLLAKFPSTNETLMAVIFVINLIVCGGMIALEGRAYWLSIALIPFTGVFYFVYRASRIEAEKQLAAEV